MAKHVLKPKHGLLDIDLKGVWRYRDLVYMYIKRDIVTKYKQTVLGPLWYVIQPALTTIIYMFVFGGLAGISTDGVPQPLFYMAGILLWNYFAECFNGSNDIFGTNASVFGKVYFPRLVVPISSSISNLIKMLIQFVLFLIIYIYYMVFTDATIALGWSALLFPILIIMLALHATAWGLIFSSMTTKYRDLKFLVQFGIQLFMYATPIIYPLSVAPEKYRFILELNPLTPIFEAFKYGWLGAGSLSWGGLLYSTIFMAISLFAGVVIFSKEERTFMDTI